LTLIGNQKAVVSEKGKRLFSKYFDTVPLMSYLNFKKGHHEKKTKGTMWKRGRKIQNTRIMKKNIHERRICHAIGQFRRGLTNQEQGKSEISASFIRKR
jgi:hypothetical protein